MKASLTQLNWRTYLPADEREYELYSKAYRRSYSFMCGLLLSIIFFYQGATSGEGLNPATTRVLLLVYILVGFILAEWAGSRVFVGHEVSFSKKRPAFSLVEGTWSGLFVLIVYVALATFMVTWLSNILD